jgi:MFS family permease
VGEWAITGMWAVIVTTVFPIYYQTVVAADLPGEQATRNFALATTIGIVAVALVAPLLGAITDRRPLKKRLLAVFASIGIAGAAARPWPRRFVSPPPRHSAAAASGASRVGRGRARPFASPSPLRAAFATLSPGR